MGDEVKESPLSDILGSFGDMLPSSDVTIPVGDSDGKDIFKMINDRICGLLEEETLTDLQVQVLIGLLNARA